MMCNITKQSNGRQWLEIDLKRAMGWGDLCAALGAGVDFVPLQHVLDAFLLQAFVEAPHLRFWHHIVFNSSVPERSVVGKAAPHNVAHRSGEKYSEKRFSTLGLNEFLPTDLSPGRHHVLHLAAVGAAHPGHQEAHVKVDNMAVVFCLRHGTSRRPGNWQWPVTRIMTWLMQMMQCDPRLPVS